MASTEDERPRRVDVGFYGNQVLSVRMKQHAYDALHEALAQTEGRRWHEVETEDSIFSLDLDKVVYLRLETEHGRVGF